MLLPYHPPSTAFWLGTDAYGASMLARLVDATWDTMYSVLLAVGVAILVGTLVGAVLAFTRRSQLRVLCEVLLSFSYAAPLLLLVLLVLVVFGERFWVFPSVGLLSWGGIALAASTSLERVLESGYVRASRNFGVSLMRACLIHGIPHALPTIVSAGVALASQLFQLSVVLAFIGVGSNGLGALIREGYQVFPSAWWMWVPATVVAALLLGGTAWAVQKGVGNE